MVDYESCGDIPRAFFEILTLLSTTALLLTIDRFSMKSQTWTRPINETRSCGDNKKHHHVQITRFGGAEINAS